MAPLIFFVKVEKSSCKGAGKKGGLSENRDIGNGYIGNRCISDTFDDVISDMSISDISIAKNGHIGLDISKI
jgi:hypothetical protein